MPENPAALARLIERLKGGDIGALARCISLTEQGGSLGDSLHRAIYPATGRAAVVGFSGPPGAGKSTLIDAYIKHLRTAGRTVAVAAVDPSSPISGGAVLGDRVRMQRHTEDPGVFIRSIASRGHAGGLSANIHRVVDLMDVSGRDVVLIETVGTGQSEIEVVDVADICVIVNAPNLGDEVQAIKAGILEIADVLVVNKSDLPLASRTTDQLRAMLRLRSENRDVAVVETVATTGQGIDALAAAIDDRAAATGSDRRAKRLQRMRRLIAHVAGQRIRDRVLAMADDEAHPHFNLALEGHIGIGEAADRALDLLAEPAARASGPRRSD